MALPVPPGEVAPREEGVRRRLSERDGVRAAARAGEAKGDSNGEAGGAHIEGVWPRARGGAGEDRAGKPGAVGDRLRLGLAPGTGCTRAPRCPAALGNGLSAEAGEAVRSMRRESSS